MKRTLDELAYYATKISNCHTTGQFTGYFDSREAKLTINYSSILTYLIKECGRLCDSYASDLFIEWNAILDKFKDSDFYKGTPDEPQTVHFFFGIRESGVDANEWIKGNINDYDKHAYLYYRALYVLEVKIRCGYLGFTDCFEGDIEMELKKCSL